MAPVSSRPVRRTAGRVGDLAIASVLGLLVLAVHDVGYLLRTPYWLDESWVAVAAKVPLRDLPRVSASSPLGWTLLVRMQELGGEQRQRLVPLAFAGLAVALGYLVLRSSGYGRLAATLAGALPVLLVPAMLQRSDLKQYTADAAVFLLIMLCVALLEAQWSHRRLVILATVTGLAPLLSSASVLGGAAALCAVSLACLMRRDWSRLRQSVVAGLASGGCMLVLVLLTVQHNANSSLTGFWTEYYLPRTPIAFVRAVDHRVSVASFYAGFTHASIALVLVSLGVVTLVRSGRLATALLVPFGLAVTAAGGVAHVYPFLDIRTSTWLLVGSVVVMGAGVADTARFLAARVRRGRLIVLALTVASVAWMLHTADPWLRLHSIYPQDVRSQTAYVEQHRRPGDVVLVSLSATWAYAYYSSPDPVPVRQDLSVATGFVPDFTRDRTVVAMTGRGPQEVDAAVARAVSLAAPGGTVWVVRTQVAREEQPAWDRELARCGSLQPVGVDPLLVLTPARGC